MSGFFRQNRRQEYVNKGAGENGNETTYTTAAANNEKSQH